MKRPLQRLSLGLILLAGVTTGRSQTAAETEATPALWKVQGSHETVYLFGTVHVMKPEVKWQTAKVMDAFRQSNTLYLEIAKLDDMASMQPMVLQLGMDQEHPLSTKLSKEDEGLLSEAVKGMGMDEAMFEPMQPWMVYMTLQVLPMIKAGYSPQSGVDVALTSDAKEGAKPVVGFETVNQQLHMLADFSQAQQVELLHQELLELPKAPEQTRRMMEDWTAGNVEAIADMENGAFRSRDPELYKKLVVERNQRWADQLSTLLKSDKPGVAFVAVGAAHLAGPDSLQHQLEAHGFKSVRQ